MIREFYQVVFRCAVSVLLVPLLVLTAPGSEFAGSVRVGQGIAFSGGGYQGGKAPRTMETGDSCSDPFFVPSLPFHDTGSTLEYSDTYGNSSPDVWYRFTVPVAGRYTIDLCESGYNTYIHVLTDDCSWRIFHFNAGCGNDRTLVSRYFQPGDYLVCVEGYGMDGGDYSILIYDSNDPPCQVTCEAVAIDEGEPDCSDGYVDLYNSGCQQGTQYFSQIEINQTVCGTSGTFILNGEEARDTDWYLLQTDFPGNLYCEVRAEFPVILSLVDFSGCDEFGQNLFLADSSGPCETVSLVFPDFPAGTYLVYVAPTEFSGVEPGSEYQLRIRDTGEFPPGLDCEHPYPIVLPAQSGSVGWQTTCGMTNGFNGVGGCTHDISDGEDMIYELTVTEDIWVYIRITYASDHWTTMALADNCEFTNCIDVDYNYPGEKNMGPIHLVPGTYYLQVDISAAPYCIHEYHLEFETVAPCPDQNDNRDNAQLVDLNQTYTGNTCDFCEDGFMMPTRDAVFKLDLAEDYYGSISLCGSSFATALEIYTQYSIFPSYFDYYGCDPVSRIDFCDEPLPAGLYYIVIEGRDGQCGEFVLSFPSCNTTSTDIPEEFSLGENYPNPFNPATTIEYALAEPTQVRLAVYNVSGGEVAVLVDGPMSVGRHQVTFQAGDLPSGIYFYTLRAGDFTATRKMTVMK